jgi:hypothetical protein
MIKTLLVVALLAASFTARAQMSEAECYKLQTEAYKHADSEKKVDKKHHLEISIKLTEECGYLMTNEVLKQRREYNYLLHQQLNK